MILVVDCGNTRIKWAHASGGTLEDAGTAAYADGTVDPVAALADAVRPQVRRALVSNVAGPGVAERVAAALTGRIGAPPEFPTVVPKAYGVECAYRDPSRLGVDRWLAMIAAVRAASGPVCVLGAGTAVTFDAVDADGRHLGGLILPGAGLAAELLDRHTSGIGRTVLPEQLPAGLDLLGRSTDEAVGNGSLLAIAAALDRAVTTVAEGLGTVPAVILTGGDAERVLPWLETRVHLKADLVLEGLSLVAGDSGSRRA